MRPPVSSVDSCVPQPKRSEVWNTRPRGLPTELTAATNTEAQARQQIFRTNRGTSNVIIFLLHRVPANLNRIENFLINRREPGILGDYPIFLGLLFDQFIGLLNAGRNEPRIMIFRMLSH